MGLFSQEVSLVGRVLAVTRNDPQPERIHNVAVQTLSTAVTVHAGSRPILGPVWCQAFHNTDVLMEYDVRNCPSLTDVAVCALAVRPKCSASPEYSSGHPRFNFLRSETCDSLCFPLPKTRGRCMRIQRTHACPAISFIWFCILSRWSRRYGARRRLIRALGRIDLPHDLQLDDEIRPQRASPETDAMRRAPHALPVALTPVFGPSSGYRRNMAGATQPFGFV